MRIMCLAAFLAGAIFAGAADGASLHISPQGDDAAPGTADAPVQSLGRLQSLLAERPDATEAVFHDGVYRGSLTVSAPEGADEPPPLLLRAAEGATPVLDGGLPLPAEGAATVEGAPGVYRLDAAPFLPYRDATDSRRGLIPPLWDETARVRYALVGDLRAVERFPGAYTFEGDSLYLHTPDGRHPVEHSIEYGPLPLRSGGLIIQRPDVTVRGLKARNYSVEMFSAGFLVQRGAERATLEDCVATNCSRGFRVRGHHARLLRCRAEDVGTGVLLNGDHGTVEDGVFLRGPRDGFRIPMPDVQEDTGIEIYHPAGGETLIRGNTVHGFSYGGVFVKCLPGEFLVERNTLVGNRFGVGCSTGRRRVIMRHNLVLGGTQGLHARRTDRLEEFHRAYGNVIWPGPWAGEGAMRSNLEYMNRVGEGNVLADPRLAAPEAGDFRLLPDSPCIDRAGPGQHAGAWGSVPDGFADVHPPLVNLSEQPALARLHEPPTAEEDRLPLFAASSREFPLRVRAHDAAGEVALVRVRVGDGPWGEPTPYAEDVPVRLPADVGEFEVQARAADGAGNWSEPASVRVVAAAAAPALVGEPTVRANRHGAAVSFRTNVPCHAVGEASPGQGDAAPLLAAGTTAPGETGPARTEHVLGLLRGDGAPEGPWRFRVRLSGIGGEAGQEFAGAFRFAGEGREWFVSPDGEDAEGGGTAESPWRTLQYAADRALPGDRVVLRPGLYAESVHITRGGAEGAPLVFASEEKWGAVLDGRYRLDWLVFVEHASHLEFEGLELRWFGDVRGDRAQSAPAFRLERAPNVAVRECKIWNDFYQGRRLGGWGVRTVRSPGLVLERSLLVRLDWAMVMSHSPRARIVFNTFRDYSHGGLNLRESVAGTVIRNNCLTYPGNYAYWIIAEPDEMETFDSDYNNLGTRIRHWRDEPGVVPNLPWSWGWSKTVVGYQRRGGTFRTAPEDAPAPDEEGWKGPEHLPYLRHQFLPHATTPEHERGARYLLPHTFEDWQAFSGLDKNSIFADPMHRDVVAFDYRLLPDSPNIGAGEGGATIGAMPVYEGD